jgi:hypothetical protein
MVLVTKLKEPEARFWYAQKAIENGWGRDILVMQIESNLFDRQGGAITNFARSLPAPQSDLAQQLIKDPYNFDSFIWVPELKVAVRKMFFSNCGTRVPKTITDRWHSCHVCGLELNRDVNIARHTAGFANSVGSRHIIGPSCSAIHTRLTGSSTPTVNC